jgi:hypothetical protein
MSDTQTTAVIGPPDRSWAARRIRPITGAILEAQQERRECLTKDTGMTAHSFSAVPPHFSGCISATDCEKVHEYPAKSSALYCRSPYG